MGPDPVHYKKLKEVVTRQDAVNSAGEVKELLSQIVYNYQKNWNPVATGPLKTGTMKLIVE